MKELLKRIPGVARLSRLLYDLRRVTYVPPGHYYSPVPSKEEISRYSARIFDCSPRSLAGIDLNERGQRALLEEIAGFYGEQPFGDGPRAGLRYRFVNDFFAHADALVLYGIMRRFRPRRIVEVGSGFSSALMLDVNERFLEGRTRLTFIDPNPERLRSLLTPADERAARVEARPVQDAAPELFGELEKDDVLFIDSSHVARTGGDVNHLFFEVLPSLKPGVLVHVHDVFWPFEYAREWIEEERAWNEAYLLRAFLQFNDRFRIELYGSYLEALCRDRIAEAMPIWLKTPARSLWLRRVA